MPDLTLPADIAVRECSPCRGEHGHCIVLRVEGDQAQVAWTHPCAPVRRQVVTLSSLSLDFTDATGRAHATWWLGAHLGLPPDLAARVWLRHDGEGWSVEVDGSRWSWGTYGDTFQRHVPALADLDPDDPRTLDDGSRLVDALALRLVCLHEAGRAG